MFREVLHFELIALKHVEEETDLLVARVKLVPSVPRQWKRPWGASRAIIFYDIKCIVTKKERVP